MKKELIKHLNGKDINCIHSLWGEAKEFYRNKSIPMGGSYASFSTDISVVLNVNKEMIRFKVSLYEVKS